MGIVLDKSCRETQNTYSRLNNFFPRSRRLWNNFEKYGGAREATNYVRIQLIRVTCWISTHAHTHAHTYGHTCNTHCFSTAKWLAAVFFSCEALWRVKVVICLKDFYLKAIQSINQSINHLALQSFVGFRLFSQVSPSSSILSCFFPIFNFQLF